MARKPRFLEDNGYYHILTRGNDRRRLFRTSQDFFYFLKLVDESLEKHHLMIYHYCLMTNHLHFLVKALKAGDMPRYFQILFQRYANYFRKRYRHTGYLFQNRYKSLCIDKESYLLECGRYIERNPLRADMVKDPKDYEWSSFLYYAHGKKNVIIKEPNPLYIELANSELERQQLYREYIYQERPFELLVDKGVGIE